MPPRQRAASLTVGGDSAGLLAGQEQASQAGAGKIYSIQCTLLSLSLFRQEKASWSLYAVSITQSEV